MPTPDPLYRLLRSPWGSQFAAAIGQTRRELFIASPFVNTGGVKTLAQEIENRACIRLTLLTCLTSQSILNGSTEPAALNALHGHFSQVRISSLGRLHAKVYVIDRRLGIITSANLTSGGIRTNFEYGILTNDRNMISSILEDMNHYYALGNVLDYEALTKIQKLADEASRVRRQVEGQTEAIPAAVQLRQAIDDIESVLLHNRVKEGRTVNDIFSETIVFALQKHGPMTTQQLHGFIQPLHPDICDDSVDRVINGQQFGKRWKHLVRSAQQHL